MARKLHEWLEMEVPPPCDPSPRRFAAPQYFADPIRRTISDPNYMFSPADGIILYQRTVRPDECILDLKGHSYSPRDALQDPQFAGPSLVIGICLTRLDAPPPLRSVPRLLSRPQPHLSASPIHPSLGLENFVSGDLRRAVGALEFHPSDQRLVHRYYSSILDQSYCVLQLTRSDIVSFLHLDPNPPLAAGERLPSRRGNSQVDLLVPLSPKFSFVMMHNTGDLVTAGIDPLIKLVEKQTPSAELSP